MNQNLDAVGDFNDEELTNNIVMVSKLQVALGVRIRTLQSKLEQLIASTDTQSMEGLFKLLQQTATLLLDYSNFWTHVLASSQPCGSRETAAELFSHLQAHERSKVNTRTEVGRDSANAVQLPVSLGENHFFVVVTLLLCTADDQPLFKEIYSASLLRDVFQEITIMRESYLIGFDLLWSPPGTMTSAAGQD
jgi:uncharacterized membrane protein